MKTIVTTFIFESESNPEKVYQTLQMNDGTVTCDCPGYRFKRTAERTCRHLRLVLAGLGNRHAIRVVESGTLAKRTPQKAMAEPVFTGRRRFALE